MWVRRPARATLALLAAAAACGGDAGFQPLPPPPECNGAEALCPRSYDAVAYATTHNAMSNADEGWEVPNQRHGITRQLEDGVRGLMLDAHPFEDGVALCHLLCQLGMTPLEDGLAEIRAFLDGHRGEVVTIIFESYVPAADVAAAFEASDAIRYVHAHAPGTPWPTLRELIDADERLVVFTDAGGELPWYHDVWTFAVETPFSFREPADMTCDPNRGDPANDLFILNHFLTQTTGSPELAELVNHDPFFIDRARTCEAAMGRLPNFVTVDYYDIGDVFGVVDELNGI